MGITFRHLGRMCEFVVVMGQFSIQILDKFHSIWQNKIQIILSASCMS